MKIAFIGLGEMGRRMCLRLIKAGHSVTVYNRSHDKTENLVSQGAVAATSVIEACRDADVAISMLRDDPASEEVWSENNLRELSSGNKRLIVVEMSTLSKAWTSELANKMRDHGIPFVASPVIGSLLPAENGKLVLLPGGDRTEETRLSEVFKELGEKIFWLETAAASATLKLAVNFYFSLQVKGIVETLKIIAADEPHLSPKAYELFKALPIVSPPIAGIIGLIVKGSFSPSFPIHLVTKDLRYFSEIAMPNLAVHEVMKVFETAEAAGLGHENIHAIWKL